MDFHFDNVVLYDGSWEEALDMLRPYSGPKTSIGVLLGWECSDPSISPEAKKRVFHQDKKPGVNAVEAYLRGDIDRNPFIDMVVAQVVYVSDDNYM